MIRMKQNKGFSLIELIIAIAILVILTGFLAPNLIRHLEKSRESVCRKNMDEMLNIYRVEYVGDDKYKIDNVITAYKDREPCPSNGIYEDGTDRMGMIPWIFCSIHDAELLEIPSELIASDKIYNDMIQFTGLTQAEIAKIVGLEAAYIRNDTLREYLWKQNGNTWPAFDSSFTDKYPELNGLYIQPCLNIPSEGGTAATNANHVVVFASAKNDGKSGSWNTGLIYDPEEKAWYQNPSSKNNINVNTMNWDSIKKKMNDENWVKLE